ncbi:hypothetical protein GCK32_018964, partial [Trichostrongylus colubriformis]
LYTPLDLARRKNHQVVVDYLSRKHEAKAASDIPDEEREKNRITFEEQLVQAKLNRGRHLHDEDDENDAMMRKSKAKRRRSMENVDSSRETKSTGVNTNSIRRASSADLTKAFPKSTSTTDLTKVEALDDEKIEKILREELQKIAAASRK